ncbi:hypothetical protein [Thioclava kandeliae]|uniref:Uncharacterized protein n=1 Tax=Thioclava kandeliae TaxID=3070818 RepID=A0ABV1SFF2_9RHOB
MTQTPTDDDMKRCDSCGKTRNSRAMSCINPSSGTSLWMCADCHSVETELMQIEIRLMEKSGNLIWADKTRRICAERDDLRDKFQKYAALNHHLMAQALAHADVNAPVLNRDMTSGDLGKAEEAVLATLDPLLSCIAQFAAALRSKGYSIEFACDDGESRQASVGIDLLCLGGEKSE